MTARNASGRQAALLKARERRQALDRERDARDQRIEEATATVLVALEERAALRRALDALNDEIGVACQALIAEGVPAERAAALVELDAAEVRRLMRRKGRSTHQAASPPATPEAGSAAS